MALDLVSTTCAQCCQEVMLSFVSAIMCEIIKIYTLHQDVWAGDCKDVGILVYEEQTVRRWQEILFSIFVQQLNKTLVHTSQIKSPHNLCCLTQKHY